MKEIQKQRKESANRILDQTGFVAVLSPYLVRLFSVCSQAPLTKYIGHDSVAFVRSLNLHSRHLNESQRGMVAAPATHGFD